MPKLAEGVELVGEYQGSGSSEAQYLVRRADGQFVHLSRQLYLVAEAVDGRRNLGQIAERVSQEFGRVVSADNVVFIATKKLAPLGVLATAEPYEPPRHKESVLGLNYRLGVVPAGAVRCMTAPFLPLFWRPVVAAVLCGLVALDVWIVFVHGVGQGVLDVIYQPSLTILFFGVELVAMAWHELGHATACRYGGAKPGKVGVGLYVVWFVLFSDVTDSYRLDKVGRVRTDCGGLYFDAIFTLAIVGAYFLTGFEPLLALAIFNQLSALDELSPFLRLDGYYIVSDLTGVPDLFKYIAPTLKGLIPGREADESVKALKPWVRRVITAWVLSVVPVLLLGFAMLVYYGPWVAAATWDSFFIQYGEVLGAFEGGSTIGGVLGVINMVALVAPVVGGILVFAWVGKLLIAAAWRWPRERGRSSAPDPGLRWMERYRSPGVYTAPHGHRGRGRRARRAIREMLGRHAKTGVLVLALVVLVVEGFFVYRWYDRYHGPDAAAASAASGGAAGLEAARGAGPGATQGTQDADEPGEASFVHRATDRNSRGDYTYVSDPRIDGDPDAVVLAAPSTEHGGAGDGPYGHNVGVWYEPGAKKWAVFNQDRAAVPAGAAFEVLVPQESEAFVHRAEPADTVGNATYLNDPLTDGEPGAAVSVTQYWNPGGGGRGVYNDHPVGVFYDEGVDKWAVYNEDGARVPEGAAFNVAVLGGTEPPAR